MTDPATLLQEAKCYICLGISQFEALQLALLAQIANGGGSVPVDDSLVYRATLTQSGTGAPVASVLKNTVGNIVWTRTGQGKYLGTLAGAFPANKTHILCGDYPFNVGSGVVFSGWLNANQIQVSTFDTADGYTDDFLNQVAIQILVYP